jgi:hypothetical protein
VLRELILRVKPDITAAGSKTAVPALTLIEASVPILSGRPIDVKHRLGNFWTVEASNVKISNSLGSIGVELWRSLLTSLSVAASKEVYNVCLGVLGVLTAIAANYPDFFRIENRFDSLTRSFAIIHNAESISRAREI